MTGTPGLLVGAWLREHYTLVVSETMLDRLAVAWQKPYFRSRLSDQRREQAFNDLREFAEFVEPAADVRGVADDLEDDLVLATAVTGDRGLLERDGYRGLILMTPAAFRLVLVQPETAARR